eukprot:gene2708-5330_t
MFRFTFKHFRRNLSNYTSISSLRNRNESSSDNNNVYRIGQAAIALAFTCGSIAYNLVDNKNKVEYEKDHTITNWSGTHHYSPSRLYEPKSVEELESLLASHQYFNEKIRPIGTALSPNGIGMSRDGSHAVSVAHMDKIEVNPHTKQVTVGAGARVCDVLKELRKYNLTLQNFSSIQEQQMGGWTQVAAHGTGITLPTVEEQIKNITIVTPNLGQITLDERHAHLFSLMKVGLGSLGVVTDMTLQCIPTFNLEETTFQTTRNDIQKDHMRRLRSYRHVRYMWYPYSNHVIAVVSNPTNENTTSTTTTSQEPQESDILPPSPTTATTNIPSTIPSSTLNAKDTSSQSTLHTPLPTPPPLTAIHTLALELLPHLKNNNNNTNNSSNTNTVSVSKLSIPHIRDLLLDIDPLNLELVQRINRAEAQSWAPTTNTTPSTPTAMSRVGDSTDILGFECGGQQLVFEVCIPMGQGVVCLSSDTPVPTTEPAPVPQGMTKDISFVRRLLEDIEKAGLPAPGPIEQRWTASSTSLMSPAYSTNPNDIFTWVGIIMYLPPSQSPEQRRRIQHVFDIYRHHLYPIMKEYGAVVHWGKICIPPIAEIKTDSSSVSTSSSSSSSLVEITENDKQEEEQEDYSLSSLNLLESDVSKFYSNPKNELEFHKEQIRKRYNVEIFNEFRKILDPNNILSNDLIDELFNENDDK